VPARKEVEPSPPGVPGAVTDTELVEAFDVDFAGAQGTRINGYLARPAGAARPIPGMIVIHEAGGLREHIRDVTNRFAAAGFLALGVDLYTREGGPPPTDDMQAVMARLFSMSDATVVGDLAGAADFLRSHGECSGRVGCIGFCMGGRHTLLFACMGEHLDAAVDCWGGFIDKATFEQRSTSERPTPPLEIADRLSCPLLAAIGAEDGNPSPAVGEQLRARALQSGQEVKVDVYEGAGHAFFADYRPTYRPGPAAKLWAEILPFLQRHLAGA